MISIFVGNLPLSSTEDDVRRMLSRAHGIANIRLVRDRYSEQSRWYALVTVEAQEHARAALTILRETMIGDTPLVAEISRIGR